MREIVDCDELVETLAELPPSSKLVFKVLQYEGRLTEEQLRTETQLTERTLCDSTTRLQNIGAITVELVGHDSHQPVYAIAGNVADCFSSPSSSTSASTSTSVSE